MVESNHFDRANVEDSYAFACKAVGIKRAQIDTDLARLASATFERAVLGAALHGGQPSAVDDVRAAARCGAAKFAVFHAGGQPVDAPLLDAEPVRLSGQVPPSLCDASSWLSVAWCAIVARDLPALALLAAVPVEAMRVDGVGTPPHCFSLARAVCACFVHGGPVGALLLQALRETDPQHLDRRAVEWVMHVDVPAIELFRAVAENDVQLDDKLRRALADHRTFFRKDAFEIAGYVALAPLALACAAIDRGGRVSVESTYLPPELLRVTPPSDPLVCCPYCITPFAQAPAICPACLGDTTADAAIDLVPDQWRARSRKPCSRCAAPLLDLAVVCPSCRTRQ